MSPGQSSRPDEEGQANDRLGAAGLSWGSRASESESTSRADADSRARGEDRLVRCPACGSEKTTAVQSADRGIGSSIRRDNPGHKCFACGHAWTVTIEGDHDRGPRSRRS